MTIKVDQEKCIGCGACQTICPQIFALNEQGKSEVISQQETDCVKEAEQACPAGAISVE